MSEPIRVEQVLDASVDEVWAAITELEQMRQWFFENIPAFEPVVGFETQFNVVAETRSFMHLWRVTEVVPKKRIVQRWQFQGYPGESLVAFELSPINAQQTELRVTADGVDTFPQDVPEFRRESGVQGWNYFIKDQLYRYLSPAKSQEA